MKKTYNNKYLQEIISQAIGPYDTTPKLEAVNQEGNHDEIMLVDKDLTRRTAVRLFNEEIRRQQNLEDVFDEADAELGKKPTREEKPIDEDWTRRFVGFAKDISSDELKNYWGKLLAGEIEEPGTYSYRMMQLLSQLTYKDAKRIRKVFKFALFVGVNGTAHILRTRSFNPITMEELLFMQELGLFDSNANLVQKHKNSLSPQSQAFLFSRNDIGLSVISSLNELSFPVYKLTSIGKEFLRLNSDVETDMDYLKKIADSIVAEHNGSVSVQCGKIVIIDSVYWRMESVFYECK